MDNDAVLVHYASSDQSSYIYRKTGIRSPAPVLYLRRDGRDVVYVAPYEFLYYREHSCADEVRSIDTLAGYAGRFAPALVTHLRDTAASVVVPAAFPAWLLELLLANAVPVRVEEYPFLRELLVNTEKDLAALREVAAALGQCLDALREDLGACRIRGERLLLNGEELDSQALARRAMTFLAQRDIVCEYAIAACGATAFHPHPQVAHPLRAGDTIIVDIACRSVSSGFFADAARTWCRGEPRDDRFMRLYDLVSRVKTEVERRMVPGASVSLVHRYTIDLLAAGGVRQASSAADLAGEGEPVIHHALGHGIGRDLHQPPIIGEEARVPLMSGMAMAFEPGCYLRGHGGVRLEDTLEVTSSGVRQLTQTSGCQFIL